jgi:hypothetical protein
LAAVEEGTYYVTIGLGYEIMNLEAVIQVDANGGTRVVLHIDIDIAFTISICNEAVNPATRD